MLAYQHLKFLMNQTPCCLYTYIYFTGHTAALGNMEHISNENRTQIRQLEIQAHRAVQNINQLANSHHSKSHPRPASVCPKIPTFQNSSGLITSHRPVFISKFEAEVNGQSVWFLKIAESL